MFTIFVQSMCAVWWASSVYARLDNLQSRVDILERLVSVTQNQSIAIAHLEEKMTTLGDGFKEIRAQRRQHFFQGGVCSGMTDHDGLERVITIVWNQ